MSGHGQNNLNGPAKLSFQRYGKLTTFVFGPVGATSAEPVKKILTPNNVVLYGSTMTMNRRVFARLNTEKQFPARIIFE